MSFRPHVPPIVQSTAFLYDNALEAEAGARGEIYCYSREANPTEDELAREVAALEGAEAALTFSTGMGAMAAALEAFLQAGDHLVALRGLYGGTHALITQQLSRFGVAHTLVD